MSRMEYQWPKQQKEFHITANTNIFSHIYLTPSLPYSRVLLLCLSNDYQLKKAYDVLKWWQKYQEKNADIIIWLNQQELNSSAAYKLLYRNKIICLTTPDNINGKIINLEKFAEKIFKITVGKKIDPYDLRKKMINLGYEINKQADQPGLIAVKGEVIDIWPWHSDQPFRIQFNIDKIEKIFIIKNKKSQNEIKITPKTDIIKNKYNFSEIMGQDFSLLLRQDLQENINEKIITKLGKIFWLQNWQEKNSYYLLDTVPNWQNNHLAAKHFIDSKKKQNYKINIIGNDKEKIKNFARENSLTINFIKSPNIEFAGLVDKKNKQIFFSQTDLFSQPISVGKKQFTIDFDINDYVVHRDHGVAKLTEMTWQEISNVEREYFVLHYDQGDKLYLPVEQADKISKYLGVSKPKLNRLGAASTWPQTVRKIKQDILKLAQELLNIYARRQLSEATPLLPHPEQEAKLAEDFPYEETPDQHQALVQTLDDLSKDTPTDRLICGDVGFGKTEIAIRAAWRTVLNKKQVMLLCPTTILSQQHYDTFTKRFADYGVNIDLLSRFVNDKDIENSIDKIKKHGTDIIIGTHRLLSKDIKPADLGLIIIDEEQQFGVKDKEKLKDIKSSAHNISLSATPIPRTLNMSLSGLRDISVISTPPQGRMPIKTYIKKYSEELIKQAINDELKRNGQVYFLYNDVKTINEQKKLLSQLVPKAKIDIVHGQLSADKIANVMHEFDIGKIDVLICSTIIANGLDLPNVNTLIVDRAQNFGLAQLYQIRGRIGRSQRQAYAYFLYHSLKLTGLAAKRLQALQAAEELGAGFQIAMRDMEIRGVGNILGKKQHGKASLVGLNLYHELINQTVAEIKTGLIPKPLLHTNIELPLSYGLPKKLGDDVNKLHWYQRIANSQTVDELKKTFSNFKKPWPEKVKNLFYIMQLKIYAQQADITSVEAKKISQADKIFINFASELDYKIVKDLLEKNSDWEFDKDQLKIDLAKLKNWQDELLQTIKMFV